jgi:2-phospho-L-lactate guanylyltransferase
MTRRKAPGIVAVVPVKALDDVKQRLAGALDPAQRSLLVLAMLHDVLAVLRKSAAFDEILLVSPDETLRTHARRHGAVYVRDAVYTGHSAAAEQGRYWAESRGAAGIVCIGGDVPLIAGDQIRSICSALRRGPRVILGPDRHGTGTNLVALSPPAPFLFQFGPGSFAAHVDEATRRGLRVEVLRRPEIGLDVDAPEDLRLLAQTLAQVASPLLTATVVAGLSRRSRSEEVELPA